MHGKKTEKVGVHISDGITLALHNLMSTPPMQQCVLLLQTLM